MSRQKKRVEKSAWSEDSNQKGTMYDKISTAQMTSYGRLEYAKKAKRLPKNHLSTDGSKDWWIVVRKNKMEMADISVP